MFDKGHEAISYVEETWMNKDTAATSVEFLHTLQTIWQVTCDHFLSGLNIDKEDSLLTKTTVQQVDSTCRLEMEAEK
jgi:hypothetical protein